MKIRFLAGLILLSGALFLGGCATPSQPAAMVAAPLGSVTKHAQAISVTVTGGTETSAAGASKISNSDFAEAVGQSITQSGLFARTAAANMSDYQLDLQIVRLDQPMIGFSMTVTLEVTWKLARRNDHQIVWQKAITSTYTAKAGDAFAGVTRLRLATEGAARGNIQDAMGQMSALILP
jgi:ABC-type uncharacterized transport system auxiliary subunit